MIIKYLVPGISLYRVDSNKGLKGNTPGRVLLSPSKDLLLFGSSATLVPKEIAHQVGVAETIEETVGSDLDKGNSKQIKGIYFEGARTNNHGILAPTEEFLTDLMIAYMRHRMQIYTAKVKYNTNCNYHAASSTASGLGHILQSMMNLTLTAHLKVTALPESATTLRSSLLPAIEQAFCQDGSSYLAKKLSSSTFRDFLAYLSRTSVTDYTKDD